MDKREQYLCDFIWPGNNPQTTLPTAANPKPSYLLPPSFHPSPGPASGPQIPTCLRSACEQAQAEPAGGQDAPDTRSSSGDVLGGGGGIHLCHTSLHLPLRTDVLWKTPGHTHKPTDSHTQHTTPLTCRICLLSSQCHLQSCFEWPGQRALHFCTHKHSQYGGTQPL